MVDLECCGLAAEVNVIADNVELASGSGGATLAADEITGVHHQRVKVQHGVDGSATDVSSASPLPVIVGVGDIIDANNSTTTPLAGDASFEPASGTDCLGYAAVTVTLTSSHDSATDGMTFEWSTDDSNWDDVYIFNMDVSDSATRRFQFPVTARYFRLSYTNGSTLQTSFRVQTILHTANQLTSIHRLNDDMSPDRSAQVVKAAIFGRDEVDSDFHAVRVTEDDGEMVTVSHAHHDGGTKTFRSLDVDESEEQISATECNAYWIAGFNVANQTRYLKFYNDTAANVVVGTTTPTQTLVLLKEQPFFMSVTQGVYFDTAMCVASTTGLADNDTGAPGAGEVILNIGYMN